MKTNLILNFEIGILDGQSMSMRILSNGQEVQPETNFQSTQQSIALQIDMPAQLEFIVSGRKEYDTKVGDTGTILADKNIMLASITICNTTFNSYNFPNSILCYKDDQDNIIEPAFFWNRNGRATMKINDINPLHWLIKHQEIW